MHCRDGNDKTHTKEATGLCLILASVTRDVLPRKREGRLWRQLQYVELFNGNEMVESTLIVEIFEHHLIGVYRLCTCDLSRKKFQV